MHKCSITLELAFKPVAIKPMLPERTFAVCCGVGVLVSLGQSTIETAALLNQIGSNMLKRAAATIAASQ
jgi:hypothetical protein